MDWRRQVDSGGHSKHPFMFLPFINTIFFPQLQWLKTVRFQPCWKNTRLTSSRIDADIRDALAQHSLWLDETYYCLVRVLEEDPSSNHHVTLDQQLDLIWSFPWAVKCLVCTKLWRCNTGKYLMGCWIEDWRQTEHKQEGPIGSNQQYSPKWTTFFRLFENFVLLGLCYVLILAVNLF